jgi:Zn-dependent metalloprotease
MRTQRQRLLALTVLTFLAACGTGGGESSSETDESAIAARGQSTAIDRARGHLASNPNLVLHDADHAFSARDVIRDSDGDEHVRFDRTYKGLRVLGGDVVVHGRGNGAFKGASVAFGAPIRLDVKPTIQGADAASRATAELAGTPSKATVSLVVLADEGVAQLAYEVVVEGTLANGGPEELHVVVDAHTGATLQRWSGIESVAGAGNGFFTGKVSLETAAVSGGFEMRDATRGGQATNDMAQSTRGNGTILRDADNAWGDGTLADRASIAVDAHYGASATWDFYKTVLGRNGIKNDGVGALSRVHYGNAYNNAYWSDTCFCMTYGDGDGTTFLPFTELDVAGHEMSHGVTSATANLAYRGESGGLNEATSDIFGTMVEFFANNAKDAPDYLIGEKIFVDNPSGTVALRYMYQPSLDGASPDCYSRTVKRLDVHYSSGIANHFFYLLAEGSKPAAGPASPTCDNSTVVGIGRIDAARIWYRALTVYMTSRTDYPGARAATLSAAADLFGAGSAQAKAVAAAWTAVAVP